MKQIVLSIIIIFTVLITACSDKTYMLSFADIKYSNEDKDIQNVSIDGFYLLTKSDRDSVSMKHICVFYKDGTFVSSFLKTPFDLKSVNQKERIGNFNNLLFKWGKDSCKWENNHGLYQVRHDTLCVTRYDRYYWYYNIIKYKFKIIDSRKLLLFSIETPSLTPQNAHIFYCNDEYVFIPADSLPVPDNHQLKKKKWFWKNEAEWEEYMREYKKK